MFVWLFHRVSGLVLIVLLVYKIVTGYGILGRWGETSIETMRSLHRAPALDILTVGLFTYHALYGLRTCLIDLGVRKEKTLFWLFTGLGAVLLALAVWGLILPGHVS